MVSFFGCKSDFFLVLEKSALDFISRDIVYFLFLEVETRAFFPLIAHIVSDWEQQGESVCVCMFAWLGTYIDLDFLYQWLISKNFQSNVVWLSVSHLSPGYMTE